MHTSGGSSPDALLRPRSTVNAIVFGVLLALLVPGLLPAPASAGGFSNLDIGGRRLGMLAVTARADDLTAIYHNPACLVLSDGTVIYHSETWFLLNLGFRLYDSEGNLHPDHTVKPDWTIGLIPFFAVASDFGTDRFHAGLAAYAPDAYGAALPDDEPTRYHATRVLFLASRVTATAAYELDDRFALGGSFNLVHVYMTADKYINPLVIQDPDHRFDPYDDLHPYDSKLEMDGQDWSWGLDLGVMLRPLDTLRLGAMFSGGSAIELAGDIQLTRPDGEKIKGTHRTGMAIPFMLSAGFNWEFAPDFELGMDIYYWHYQILQEQRSKLAGDDLIAQMQADEIFTPKNYFNSWNWCIGLLYHLTPSLEVMMGYQQDYTPIPDETYTLDNPSRDQHGVSAGIRWAVSDDLRVSASIVRNWFDLVDVQKSRAQPPDPPTNAKGYGDSKNIGFDVTWKL